MSVPPDPARALEAARNNAVQHLSRRLAADYPATYKAIAALAAASADLLDALAAAPPSPPTVKHCSQKCWQEGECDGTCKTPPSPPLIEALVTLVRIGFLVTVNGERADASTVNEPETKALLLTILQAEDTAAAVAALAAARGEAMGLGELQIGNVRQSNRDAAARGETREEPLT